MAATRVPGATSYTTCSACCVYTSQTCCAPVSDTTPESVLKELVVSDNHLTVEHAIVGYVHVLGGCATAVYLRFAQSCYGKFGTKDWAFLSVDTLIRDTKYSRRMVFVALEKLKRYGLFVDIGFARHGVIKYKLPNRTSKNGFIELEEGAADCTGATDCTTVQPTAQTGAADCTPEDAAGCTRTTNEEEKKEERSNHPGRPPGPHAEPHSDDRWENADDDELRAMRDRGETPEASLANLTAKWGTPKPTPKPEPKPSPEPEPEDVGMEAALAEYARKQGEREAELNPPANALDAAARKLAGAKRPAGGAPNWQKPHAMNGARR